MEVKNKKITLIAPFYNEENGVFPFFERINKVFSPIMGKYDIEVVCINDGSKDRTLDELLHAKETFHWVRIIDFSRNFGKEAAVTAGLDFADGDAVIPIDSDLQHPPELILDMLEKWEKGFDVVLAKRIDRDTDGAIQKVTARTFYKVSNKISHVEIPADVGDFRLMDRKVVEATRTLRENSRFMKGIFAWVGFRTTTVEYKVEPREYGKSSFNTWKLWNFALEGITSFSTVPLRVWSYIGGVISLFAFLYSIYLILKTVFLGVDTPGYASLMVVVLFSTGIQLIGIGILGEYIGRIFLEV
ncbi:TPA: glycosyltransferase family 2 protein, partial [Yersinia enterocolitica]|nr:glycosyltransferase family 2 protein [Yersinia enterocolitica]